MIRFSLDMGPWAFVTELNKQLAAHGLRLTDKTPQNALQYMEFQLESTAVPTTQDGVGIGGNLPMVPVTSSTIHSVGHNGTTDELHVRFKSHGDFNSAGAADSEVYVYTKENDVSLLSVFNNLMVAQGRGESVGACFAKYKPMLKKFRKEVCKVVS